MRSLILFAALSFTVVLAACDAADPVPSQVALLTAEAWVPSAADAVPVASAMRYEFRPDGVLRLEFANAPAEEESWLLEASEPVLVIQDAESTLRLAVLRLTADELVLEELPTGDRPGQDRYELVHP